MPNGKEEDKLSVDDLDFEALDAPMGDEEEQEDPELEKPEGEDEDSPEEQEKPESKPKESEEEEEGDEEGEEEEGSEGEEKPEGDEGEEADDPRIVDTIIGTLGYELSEEELEGIEDTEEGLTKLTQVISQKAAQEEFDNLINSSPNLKTLHEFERNGGNPEEFFNAFYPPTDFTKVQLEEDDVDTQKEIIRTSLRSKGLSDERIDRNLQAIEDSGNLLDESRDSLKDLQTMQIQERERIQEETKKRQEDAKKDAEETWAKVDETLEKGSIRDLPIPKTKHNEFKAFITPDPKTGQSPRDKKAAEMTLEDHLAMDLILFYGLDGLNQIIDKKATSKSSKTLADKLKSNKNRGKNTSQDPDLEKPRNDGSTEDLEFRIGE